jgi:hypothetical protein
VGDRDLVDTTRGAFAYAGGSRGQGVTAVLVVTVFAMAADGSVQYCPTLAIASIGRAMQNSRTTAMI